MLNQRWHERATLAEWTNTILRDALIHLGMTNNSTHEVSEVVEMKKAIPKPFAVRLLLAF